MLNTRDLEHTELSETELRELLVCFGKTFRRLPSYQELLRFRCARAKLALRIPPQRRV